MTHPHLFLSFHHVGGLYHWRIGAFGGSFYHAKGPRAPKAFEAPHAACITAFSELPGPGGLGPLRRALAGRPIETVIDGIGIGTALAFLVGLFIFL